MSISWGKGAQIYLCRHPLYDTKGIKQNPTDKLFCLCQTKNDGKLYVKCETCNAWFHPTCVFPKKHLALTLTKEQWALCRCVCKGKTVSTSGSKVILYHNTANHSTTQTPAIARLSSPEHKNKTKPSQDKNFIAICCSSSADVNNCSSINDPKNDKSKDYSCSDVELNSTCSSPSYQPNTTESINHNSAGKSKTDNYQILDDNACNNALTTHASDLNSCETANENNGKFLQENDAEANAVHVGHTLMITDNTSSKSNNNIDNQNICSDLNDISVANYTACTQTYGSDNNISDSDQKHKFQTSAATQKSCSFSENCANEKNICFELVETAKEQDPCELSLNIETIEALGNFKKNLIQKERERFSLIKLNKPFFITINEWQRMTKNRSQNHFRGTTYTDILLEKLRDLYSGCVYCIDTNYLRKPSSVLNLRENDKSHYEGYVKIYCKHAKCCGCEVMGSVRFYVHHDRVEAIPKISGKRSHIRPCVKSRPLKGKKRTEIKEKLKFQRPFSIYRDLQANLTEDERAYGSYTYAPSHAVLRNIKSQENISQRYSDNWIISTQMMDKQISEKNGAFIRDIGAKPPRVVLFTDAQIKFFVDVCKRDIIYLDATGSVMKKSGEQKDFQIYTLLGRHPNEGGPALPIATSVTTCHDTRSIRNFLYIFLKVTTDVTGSKPKPLMIIIDGSMAMWNAVLLEFSNETRTKYYNRCWRIIMGKAEPGDLKQTFVFNCLSHAMRAAKGLVLKHYNKKFKKEAMYWICLLFNCTTFNELEKLMQSLFVILNCEKNSKIIKQHFDKLQQKVHEQHDLPSWQEDEVESDDLEDEDFLDPTIAIDKKQEISSNFYIHFNQQLNNFLSSQLFDAHQMFPADNQKYRNVYCNKEFCEKIVRIIISRICSTSKLMLGDLSRHYSKNNDKNMTRFKALNKCIENLNAVVSKLYAKITAPKELWNNISEF